MSVDEGSCYAQSHLDLQTTKVWRSACTAFKQSNIPVTWDLFGTALEIHLGIRNAEFDAVDMLSQLQQCEKIL